MKKNGLKDMKIIFYSLAIFSFLLVSAKVQAANNFSIAATVNKDAISHADVLDRIRLVFASSGVRNTAENREQAYPQALSSLIEEQLMIQESEKQNLPVSEDEIAEGFSAMAQQNSMTAEQFEGVIKQQGIPKSTLLRKIKAQIAWRNVVTKVLRPQIDVTESDINARLQRIKDSIGKTEYLAAEIFLPINETSEEAKTKELAEKLISEMRAGGVKFSVVAAQFSKAGSAKQGGLIGWVQEGTLPQELDVVVKSLSNNQVSPPIRSLSGFYVMTVLDKREVSTETMPSEDDVLNAIGLERLDKLQQRYLADIRSAAFIDRRGNS